MKIDELVSRLSSNATPVRPRSIVRTIGPAFVVGTIASIGFAGLISDMATIPGDSDRAGTIRVAFGLAFGGVGLALLLPSLRPGSPSPWIGRGEAAIAIVLTGLLAGTLLSASSGELATALALAGPLGSPLAITALSIPVFVALIFAVRGEAPTHLDLTGAALGLLSGGIGAASFFLKGAYQPVACTTAWYAIGIGATMLGGLLAGPPLLRW